MTERRLTKVAADSACFVCGPNNPIGLQAEFNIDSQAGTSSSQLQLPEQFQGWQDVVHGGVLAALLDEACIYACRSKADQCVTAELQVRYRKPVPVGSLVEVSGCLTDSRRKIWQAAAEIRIEGQLFAEAQAKVFVLDK